MTTDIEEHEDVDDEEKAFLADVQDEVQPVNPTGPASLSRKFWFSAGLNTVSTAAIVRVLARRWRVPLTLV